MASEEPVRFEVGLLDVERRSFEEGGQEEAGFVAEGALLLDDEDEERLGSGNGPDADELGREQEEDACDEGGDREPPLALEGPPDAQDDQCDAEEEADLDEAAEAADAELATGGIRCAPPTGFGWPRGDASSHRRRGGNHSSSLSTGRRSADAAPGWSGA